MIFEFSSNHLVEKKKSVKKMSKKTAKKPVKKHSKNNQESEFNNTGIVIVDDDLVVDRETELEERRAYLEEARSQEASSD